MFMILAGPQAEGRPQTTTVGRRVIDSLVILLSLGGRALRSRDTKMEIIRDSENCVTSPSLHDGSIDHLTVNGRDSAEIGIVKEGVNYKIVVGGLIEFGVSEYHLRMGVLEVFYAPLDEVNNTYYPEDESPWKTVLPSYFTSDDIGARRRAIELQYPNAVMLWIDCSFGGFIVAIGDRISIVAP